jgi:hypothetical protein
MDMSLNLIDLQYLTNPYKLNKITRSNDIFKVNNKDLGFYKKRIFQLTKDLLRNEKQDAAVERAFQNYVSVCINHFKFIDKMEIIQKDYENINNDKNDKNKSYDIQKSNHLIFKKNKPRIPKITDNIKIKSTKIIKQQIIPKQRKFNLMSEKFKNKGVKKKEKNKSK